MSDRIIRFGYFIALILSLALFWGCGSSSGLSSTSSIVDNNTLSSLQASNFARSLSLAATSSMSSSAFKEPSQPSLAASLFPAELQQDDALSKTLFAVSCTTTSCVINQPITATRTCSSGGSMKVSGNISGTINNTGSGVIQISATETITDWSCQSPLIINGDPYVSLAGTFSFLNGQPATQQHVGISGGFKWGTSAAQSCQIHLDTNFNRDGTGHTTGTVCDYSVDITF
jgi:hypothetical protein